MTGYWDIHNHILPGVDDGSGCMRETMEMLEEEYRQGVRHIVFTPHYRRDMFAIPREEIQTVYARVCEMAADRFPEMEFYLGCEYYIHSDASVERLRGNPKYYMAGSRTVLMEFAYEACANDMDEAEFKKQVADFMDIIYKKAAECGGLISGEHGIGYGKMDYLAAFAGETSMRLMKGIKEVFDPKMILNPGKVCYSL